MKKQDKTFNEKYKNKKQKYEVNPTIKVAFSYGQ